MDERLLLETRRQYAAAESVAAAARHQFHAEVAKAYSEGASLAQIAKVLGISRERVHQIVKAARR